MGIEIDYYSMEGRTSQYCTKILALVLGIGVAAAELDALSCGEVLGGCSSE